MATVASSPTINPGQVTGVAAGSATITGTFSGQSDTVIITVQSCSDVTVSPAKVGDFNATFPAAGGTGTVTVTINEGCPW